MLNNLLIFFILYKSVKKFISYKKDEVLLAYFTHLYILLPSQTKHEKSG
jgi:hypothetical protein